MIRKPAVADRFYPANPSQLREEISHFIEPTSKKGRAKGIIVPHAGYMYSGLVAGEVFSKIEIPNRLIILSPNHTGLGAPFSMMNRGVWRMPFGDVPIDEELADRLLEASPLLKVDPAAHLREHSLEVELPFVQYLKKDFKFVPITMNHVSLKDCKELGQAMAPIIQEINEPILIIASSDMNHYESHERTLEKDGWAINEMLKNNPEGLYNTVHSKNISMCGIIPATVMMITCQELGSKNVTLVDHKTSGDVSGDFDAVVGYAGVIVV